MATITTLKQHLHIIFSIKDLGLLSFFLGIEISSSTQGIFLSQKKLTNELLQGCSWDLHKAASTPLPVSLKLSDTDDDLYDDPAIY